MRKPSSCLGSHQRATPYSITCPRINCKLL